MKGKALFLLCFIVGLPHSVVALASQSYNGQPAVIADYIGRLNKGYEPFFTVNPETVGADKVDVNRDGSIDLVLFDKTHCEFATECEIDVYLCKDDDENCEDGEYCYADNIYKDQLKSKGRNLECK